MPTTGRHTYTIHIQLLFIAYTAAPQRHVAAVFCCSTPIVLFVFSVDCGVDACSVSQDGCPLLHCEGESEARQSSAQENCHRFGDHSYQTVSHARHTRARAFVKTVNIFCPCLGVLMVYKLFLNCSCSPPPPQGGQSSIEHTHRLSQK